MVLCSGVKFILCRRPSMMGVCGRGRLPGSASLSLVCAFNQTFNKIDHSLSSRVFTSRAVRMKSLRRCSGDG